MRISHDDTDDRFPKPDVPWFHEVYGDGLPVWTGFGPERHTADGQWVAKRLPGRTRCGAQTEMPPNWVRRCDCCRGLPLLSCGLTVGHDGPHLATCRRTSAVALGAVITGRLKQASGG